ncbi:hypothetical protein H2198_000696 [Neophaeococcomyces mojaviensis]|uniref:Uncharacterized protein n=1 Tax=Neophaeococcomyces mojaviensis TaxID=3383035 RepID=A0ACC3AJ58_9EURO|nr:hypothetical protein H2198_000696 [Knufia sp. JES_112]
MPTRFQKKAAKGRLGGQSRAITSQDAKEEVDLVEQETSYSELDSADNGHNDQNDHSDHNDHDELGVVLGNGTNNDANREADSTRKQDIRRNFELALTLGHPEAASSRKPPSIAIIVPPVPYSWKDV